MRGATKRQTEEAAGAAHFNPRTPVRGATLHLFHRRQHPAISIHAPLCGVRPCTARLACMSRHFNPRTPVRGATTSPPYNIGKEYISIHAPLCGVRRRLPIRPVVTCTFQSTHPCAGCDGYAVRSICAGSNFNPRTPVRGATPPFSGGGWRQNRFQSTHPCAGCDAGVLRGARYFHDFNPRTPVRGATRTNRAKQHSDSSISIHAPLCGVRHLDICEKSTKKELQSTHPCAGCDTETRTECKHTNISIHAPLCGVRHGQPPAPVPAVAFQSTHPCAGCDHSLQFPRSFGLFYFNPRTPVRGATSYVAPCASASAYFNPRTPVRGATRAWHSPPGHRGYFNPRTPVRGATPRPEGEPQLALNFNPRTPVRGATRGCCTAAILSQNFNPRTPVRGATNFVLSHQLNVTISIHAPLCGVRLAAVQAALQHGNVFQSTHPCAGCDRKHAQFGLS